MTRETDIQDESSRQERKTTHIRGEGSAMIQNIDHLVITVRDVEQTCDFYRRVLDLRIITFGDDRKALRVGEQKINLHQAGRELHPCAKSPTPVRQISVLSPVKPLRTSHTTSRDITYRSSWDRFSVPVFTVR